MAQVHIKKRARPIELDYSRAKILKQRKYGYDGVAKAEASDQVDLGEWAGQYGEILSIDMAVENRTDKTEKKYSDSDCKEFEKELKQFFDKKGRLTLEGELNFLKHCKVISLKKLVKGEGKTIADFEIAVVRDNCGAYAPLLERLEAWRSYKGRYAYAKKRENEEMQELSESMKVD